MNDPAPLPDLDRLRAALVEREALRAAGQAIPEDATERVARVLAADEPAPAACEAIEEQLPEFVAAELRGAAVAQLFPEVHQHLLICQDCTALHADLLELELGPEMAPLPAPVLAALRWPVAGEPLRQFVAQRSRQLLTCLALLPKGFDELIASFFELVDDFGERLTWSSRMSGAFRFSGEETSTDLRVLLATWQAALAVRDGLAHHPKVAARRAEFEQLLRASARDAARRNRLGRDAAQRFTDAFVDLALAADADAERRNDARSELPG